MQKCLIKVSRDAYTSIKNQRRTVVFLHAHDEVFPGDRIKIVCAKHPELVPLNAEVSHIIQQSAALTDGFVCASIRHVILGR